MENEGSDIPAASSEQAESRWPFSNWVPHDEPLPALPWAQTKQVITRDEVVQAVALMDHLARYGQKRLKRRTLLEFIEQALRLPADQLLTARKDLRAGRTGDQANRRYQALLDEWKHDTWHEAYDRAKKMLGELRISCALRERE